MYSYFSVISKSRDSTKRAEQVAALIAEKWPEYSVRYKCGQILFIDNNKKEKSMFTYCLDGELGVIVGTLFKKTVDSVGKKSELNIDSLSTKKIVESEGRRLLSEYWGNYIAFVCIPEENGVSIVRDPTNTLPGSYYEDEDCIIFYSDIGQLLELGLSKFLFNKVVIGCIAKTANFELQHSSLHGMKKIVGGEALIVKGGVAQVKTYWHPREFCENLAFTDPRDAMAELKKVVIGCIHAWASLYDVIILRLSGGLDSTIVLSCLSSAPNQPKIYGLNYYSPGGDEDERSYARNAASYFGIELLEYRDDASIVDLSVMRDFYFLPDPLPCRFTAVKGQYERILADKFGADALWSGEGGIQYFIRHQKIFRLTLRRGMEFILGL